MAKETKKSQTKKGTGKKNQKKSLGFSIIAAIILILAVAWTLGGKPKPVFTDGKFKIELTEEPLINKWFGSAKTAVEEVVNPDTTKTETTETVPAAKTETTAPAATGAATTSGTKGSNPALDQGNAENSPLYFGNPSDAEADTKAKTNYLMVKPQYTLSYNSETLCPNWAAWHLSTEDMGDSDRQDDFRPDPELPDGWYAVKKADYQYNAYGFDRGHVCPSADRTATLEDNSMTFLMTNMVPQSPDNNRQIWMHFENYERQLVAEGNEVYIIAGPYGTGGTSGKGTFDEIPVKLKSGETLHMNVPATTWKVCLALPKGENDLSRVTKDTTVIAINVPNQMGMAKTGDWEQYITTIDEIEKLTGYDFFELLPDEIENVLEAKVYDYQK